MVGCAERAEAVNWLAEYHAIMRATNTPPIRLDLWKITTRTPAPKRLCTCGCR